jgi:uncharacterized membrane protein
MRGLLLLAVGVLLVFFFVRWLMLLFGGVWTLIRCAKGLSNLSRGIPMAADTGWGFG